jgi:hypothetical protein
LQSCYSVRPAVTVGIVQTYLKEGTFGGPESSSADHANSRFHDRNGSFTTRGCFM